MAVSKMELLELLRKADGADVDFLREGVRVLAQALMDAEVSAQIGAEHSQRTPERTTHRNGYRARDWDTRVGTVDLQIPRVREGSYLPSFLEPRRRAERALAAVVAQCYVEGVSTRRVEDIAQAMGITSLSKSQVSRVCGELDELVAAWRNRPLDAGSYVFVWLDALVVKVREAGVRGQVLMSFVVRAHMSVAGQAESLQGTTSVGGLEAILEPVAGAADGDDVAVVQQAVKDRGGEHVVAEDAAPLAEGLVGGQQDAAALVAARDQLEDHVGVGSGQR